MIDRLLSLAMLVSFLLMIVGALIGAATNSGDIATALMFGGMAAAQVLVFIYERRQAAKGLRELEDVRKRITRIGPEQHEGSWRMQIEGFSSREEALRAWERMRR